MSYKLYLSIPTIAGEVTDPGFQNQIAVFAYSLGFSDPVSFSGSGGGAAGRPELSDLSIQKLYDRSSPPLLKALLTGSVLAPRSQSASIVLSIVVQESTPLVQLTYSFQDVFVSAVQDSGSTGGDSLPTQSISFSFGVIHEQYHTLTNGNLGSSISVGYNRETGQVS